MTTTDQLYVFEYNPQQGCYHYNPIDRKTALADKYLNTNGWRLILLVDEEIADNEDFSRIMHSILREGLDYDYVRDVAVSALKKLGLTIYDHVCFAGRRLVNYEKSTN